MLLKKEGAPAKVGNEQDDPFERDDKDQQIDTIKHEMKDWKNERVNAIENEGHGRKKVVTVNASLQVYALFKVKRNIRSIDTRSTWIFVCQFSFTTDTDKLTLERNPADDSSERYDDPVQFRFETAVTCYDIAIPKRTQTLMEI